MKAIKTVLACIRKADNVFNLINNDDKIIVGLSGGKDSLVLLYTLLLYQKFSHKSFLLQPVTLDLGFPNFNANPLKEFCQSLHLNLIVEEAKDVYPILKANQGNLRHLPCSICSRMKKAIINNVAISLNFNKVAFAHHGDDAIETYFLNAIFGGRIATFSPKMHLEKANITFIRPLLLVKEHDIIRLVKDLNFTPLNSHCPADKNTSREDIKNILSDLYKKYPMAHMNFLSMLQNYQKEDIWGNKIEYQVNNQNFFFKPVITKDDSFLLFSLLDKINDTERFKKIIDLKKFSFHYLVFFNNSLKGAFAYKKLLDRKIILSPLIFDDDFDYSLKKEVITFFINMLKKEYTPSEISSFENNDSDLLTDIGFTKKDDHYLFFI